MGLGIGTVLVLAGLAFVAGLGWLPDESESFGWTLVVLGVAIAAVGLLVHARRHRSDRA